MFNAIASTIDYLLITGYIVKVYNYTNTLNNWTTLKIPG